MPINITPLHIDRDDRLRSYCVTSVCNYRDFLALTTGAEANLNIQRGFIKGTKAYATLRADLRRGCILPPIVLAVNVNLTRSIDIIFEENDLNQLIFDFENLRPDSVYVIDGLQRTNAIRQTLEEIEGNERETFLDRKLRIELWLNVPFGAIAYRMLLLNAGQRPMSVKHQVEVLSSKLVDDVTGIPGLDVFRLQVARRRTQPGQFPLARLAQAFQAWLQGQPNLDLRNTVMEELLAESAVDVLGKSVPSDAGAPDGDGFRRLVEWIVQLDLALGVDGVGFLGNETVLLGIAAAVGSLERSEALANRVWPALNNLLHDTHTNGPAVVSVEVFDALRQGIDTSKVNVGAATRDMVFKAFKEYIRAAGEMSMRECWQLGAAGG